MALSLTAMPARAGAFLEELTAGPTPPAIALYRRVLVLGTATGGVVGTPTVVSTIDDFKNTFTSSSALILNSLEAYLKNTKLGLFFVRITAAPMGTVTVTSAATGIKSFTLGTTVISYTAIAGDTLQKILEELLKLVNDNPTLNTLYETEFEIDSAGANVYANGKLMVRSKDGNTFTLAAGTGTTIANVAVPAQLQYWDYTDAIEKLAATQTREQLSIFTCPEAFFNLVNQGERTIVGNTMEGVARQLRWFAPLDPGGPTLINTPQKAVTDAANYTAIRGHSAYYFPYLKDTDNDWVSPSVMLAAFALQRYEVEGIHQPPAGPRYPFRGISGVGYTLSNPELDLLALNRINPMIFLAGVGFVPFDTYTRSTNTNFRHISTRIILSCMEKSILDTIDASGLLFEAIGSRGIFYLKLKNLIEGVVTRFYEGDALYGASPEVAYRVICDASIQTDADLEAGIVRADVFATPAGTARQIRVNVFRVAIGKMAEALATA